MNFLTHILLGLFVFKCTNNILSINGFHPKPSVYSSRGLLPSDEVAKELHNIDKSVLDKESGQRIVELTANQSHIDGGYFRLEVNSSLLKLFANGQNIVLPVNITYISPGPLLLSYDSVYFNLLHLTSNSSWFWLPAAKAEKSIKLNLYLKVQEFGRGIVRFWLNPGKSLNSFEVKEFSVTQEDLEKGLLKLAETKENENIQQYFKLLNTTLDKLPQIKPAFSLPFDIIMFKGVWSMVFRVILMILLVIITFTMGCELDPMIIWGIIKKPIGPAIGLLCQFCLNPLIALAIIKIIPLEQPFAFGLITIGCSPGGGGSNLWALLLDGDVNLSMTMTAISCLSALGMMPLLLFLMSFAFNNVTKIVIPYGTIVMQLLLIVTPCSLGILFRHFKPLLAYKMTRLTGPLALFFLINIATFGVVANWKIYKLLFTCPIVIACGCLLPWMGFSLAGLIAFILRQPKARIITIAIETGIQNIGVAILLLLFSMPQPYGDLGTVVVISVAVFTPIPLYVIALVLSTKRRHCICIRKGERPEIAVENEALKKNAIKGECIEATAL